MPSLVDCVACGRKLRIPDELADQAVRCPNCGYTFQAEVPSLEQNHEAIPWVVSADGPSDLSPRPAEHFSPAASSLAPQPKQEEYVPCPFCHRDIPTAAVYCPHCSEPIEAQRKSPAEAADYFRGRARRDSEPHRGGMILTFGIISIVFAFTSVCLSVFGIVTELTALGLGIAAWIMGSQDLKKMQANQMDPRGMNSTHAGKICGIIGTICSILMMFIVTAMIIGIFFMAISAQNSLNNSPFVPPPTQRVVPAPVMPPIPDKMQDQDLDL